MFFFYASSWLAMRASDWLIVQGGYYTAAIAMRSSPIIPFRRDNQEAPSLASASTLLLPALPFFLPPLFTHMQSTVNRPPPALSEQMGAVQDSRLIFLAPHTHLSSSKA
uniref:Uncharacterized protein n=1 Tax=Knipowitschia caucasica TaxID=637954 RepID=A0AAV2KDP6_KNICA